jgi:HAD superfamily hydrolase (TIGR01509 family)
VDAVAPVGMVPGVPDDAEPPSRMPDRATPRRGRRRIDAVLFDFHGTLAQVEDPVDWVRHAAGACGVTLEPPRAAWLADRLVMAGRAGGPPPARVPPHLAEVFADRDLSAPAHRAAYAGLAATVDSGIEGLPEALYERILDPAGWTVYPEAAPTLSALYEAEVPVAVVSNIGFDVRPMLDAWGVGDLVAACALSYEVGRCKPDPAIFRHACALLGVEPERALMVGDSPADAGAVAVGCVALILPAPPAGQPHGLAAALDLAGVT